ncbi:hotdog fold thioesterase [Polaromonas sp. YR568]|uniref:hotdog fold thioesterase n=1 Tax=Polaromonas sp. YR568 TaxID=1855301 RepID=UPI00398C0E1E
MRIWKQPISIELLAAAAADTAITHLGIEFLEVGDDFIRGRVPVDRRTVQPYGLLHGGVALVLAETLGSCGAAFAAPAGHRTVGLDINANHLEPVHGLNGAAQALSRDGMQGAVRCP